MKMNKWTVGLAAVGLVSLSSTQAEDTKIGPRHDRSLGNHV